MNPKDGLETNASQLLALRLKDDAVRIIAEHLKVKEMGPADHIRTKHEVKVFVASGNIQDAEDLNRRATERRAAHQRVTVNVTLKHGQRASP